MTRLVVRSKVDPDGVLRVVVQVGAAEAERELQVTIESLPAQGDGQSTYLAWLDSVAGRWQGEFDRMPAGEFERRDTF